MATNIQAMGDTIKIDKAFVSGKDRIAVNGQVVIEEKINPGATTTFQVGTREYSIEFKTVSKMTGAIAYHLSVSENGEVVHTGIYDQTGKSVKDEGQAKKSGALQACGMVGGIVGFATMMFLNHATGVVPGGAIGGAIGGGGGAVLGYGIGSLLFGRK